ncbi:PREDICTED: uncharacterized protein LOC106323447 [Brassica oleracea var. oleracea]|uniref:uncharacterized protein LOC106323447 n=1 Tax=Brassica oleracea var. oleracea TaxID=109376 RepID=UPI0006A71A46|nr:PREDICTED: uncharacterized protein LOC106323447 [Brassica oleracea var. oleracea]
MIYEFKNIHAKIDGNYSDLNNKYMQLASHLKALESQVASMPSSSKQPMESLPGKPEKKPQGVLQSEAQIVKNAARKVEATNLQRAEHKAEKQVEKRADNKLKEVKLKEATEVELSPYDKLPFPQRVLTKVQKKVLSKFRKDLSDVGVRLPEISGMREAHMMKSLGIESMKPNTSSLQFGDSSSTTPIGLIKDFPLKIGACTIPIDLTVLKMATEKRVPLIIGTPFLTTVGACIDFANKKVTLLNVNNHLWTILHYNPQR